jgi:hypothetical protein
MAEKRAPFRPIFRVGNSQKSLAARAGGTVIGGRKESFSRLGIAAQQALRYRAAEATVPSTCRAVYSELHHATSATFARRNDQ